MSVSECHNNGKKNFYSIGHVFRVSKSRRISWTSGWIQGCQIFLGKTYQKTTKYTKCPQNISIGRKIDRMSINYTNIKTLQNLPKLGFLVWKLPYLATLIDSWLTCQAFPCFPELSCAISSQCSPEKNSGNDALKKQENFGDFKTRVSTAATPPRHSSEK
jgi:hypothetical protein